MHPRYILSVMTIVVIFSCSKKKEGTVEPPPPPPPQPVFLKDITIPNLPSPYYFFEYDAGGKVIHASYASGARMYEVLYSGDKISELRNNTMINKDTLRYVYDAGKVSVIIYIDKDNVTYRRCYLTYNGNRLQKIEWDLNVGVGFVFDRTITFTYLPDGNLSEMNDHLPPVNGQIEATHITKFEQYDTKINTDDFILYQEGGNPHMLLLPGVQLQKNNPRKVTRTGTGPNYTIDYTYTYNSKDVTMTKSGDVLITNGPAAGQRFPTSATHTYY